MFRTQTIVRLHETDAAGRLFFACQFKMMHDAYEQWLDALGIGFPVLLKKKNYFLPIVHAEADYKKPLFVGDKLSLEVTLSRIGETSFTLSYVIYSSSDHLVGAGKTVHVAVSRKTGKKIPLPDGMRRILKTIKK